MSRPSVGIYVTLRKQSHASTALLVNAAAGQHYCQLHHAPHTLIQAITLFVGTALRRDDGVVLIATADRLELCCQHLHRLGIDPDGARRAGRLVLSDAGDVLRQVMRGDLPAGSAFDGLAGGLIRRVRQRRAAVRIYSELGDVIWHRGTPRAAIVLEEQWNALARSTAFSLCCGYLLDGLDARSYDGPIPDLGRTHTDVLPTEDDREFVAAVDAACKDVLGLSLSLTVSFSGREQVPGEHRLPAGRRTVLWLQRNVPDSSSQILERARHYVRRAGIGDA